VEVVDYKEKPAPLLVMPFLPLGNLEDQHEVKGITEAEAVSGSSQILGALIFLDDNDVLHQDLKLANILAGFVILSASSSLTLVSRRIALNRQLSAGHFGTRHLRSIGVKNTRSPWTYGP
jgi:serine/threonine protein kinase